MTSLSARGLDPLTDDEAAVLMHMSGDLGYSAASISADLAFEQPEIGWTPKRVNAAQRSLRAKGYADFGVLTDDEGMLRGRGYWLCGAGCDLRYGKATA